MKLAPMPATAPMTPPSRPSNARLQPEEAIEIALAIARRLEHGDLDAPPPQQHLHGVDDAHTADQQRQQADDLAGSSVMFWTESLFCWSASLTVVTVARGQLLREAALRRVLVGHRAAGDVGVDDVVRDGQAGGAAAALIGIERDERTGCVEMPGASDTPPVMCTLSVRPSVGEMRERIADWASSWVSSCALATTVLPVRALESVPLLGLLKIGDPARGKTAGSTARSGVELGLPLLYIGCEPVH